MNRIITKLPYQGVMSSNIGGRAENQDSCGFSETPVGLLAVVCDGMGGGPAGKTASMIATGTILDYVKSNGKPDDKEDYGELMTAAVMAANSALRQKIEASPELNGMGTTVVAILFSKTNATIAHVGDSRAYQLRDSYLLFKTNDHSQVWELVKAGALTEEQARLSAYSNVITRALGIEDEVEVDIDVRPYEKGDRFILCTDGVWGAMPKNLLVKELSRSKSLEGTIDMLNMEVTKAGNEKGGHHDNFTTMIVIPNINSTDIEPMSRKIKLLLQTLMVVCAISLILNLIFFLIPNPSDKIAALNTNITTLTARIAELEKENAELTNQIESQRNELKEKSQLEEKYNELKTAKEKQAKPQISASVTSIVPKLNQTAADDTAQNAGTAYIIEQLGLIADRITKLGVMKAKTTKQKNDKEKERGDIRNSITQLIKENKDMDEKTRKMLNEVDNSLGYPITMREPDGTKDKQGSMSHCNKLVENIKAEIERLKKEAK